MEICRYILKYKFLILFSTEKMFTYSSFKYLILKVIPKFQYYMLYSCQKSQTNKNLINYEKKQKIYDIYQKEPKLLPCVYHSQLFNHIIVENKFYLHSSTNTIYLNNSEYSFHYINLANLVQIFDIKKYIYNLFDYNETNFCFDSMSY